MFVTQKPKLVSHSASHRLLFWPATSAVSSRNASHKLLQDGLGALSMVKAGASQARGIQVISQPQNPLSIIKDSVLPSLTQGKLRHLPALPWCVLICALLLPAFRI